MLLHPATTVLHSVPLMSRTGKQRAATKSCQSFVSSAQECRTALKRIDMFFPTHALAVTPKMSTQIRSYSFHADSGFQWVCFGSIRFAELIVHERQVQATIHFCPFPEGRTCPTNMIELQIFLARDGHLPLTCYRRYSNFFWDGETGEGCVTRHWMARRLLRASHPSMCPCALGEK